ncbi:cAMP-binding domain of CRP or a regulatory subunit of cAMP-dependent protein kinases [Dyadobacter soli]|uniref:cAMP-binding domain of CRP or a regulatory subunit of cAMP-dependent protein kinases n=1 Tax=Dyadobacter soli TaxID=659014 RepID=A0A1G7FVZ0_9BACT|nr:Crp/Fnr family transcriptional regulator [Dyadobacter soli]SDE80049.1 cAMP-binding domain of CRP or a regulatory subunit of cAMP-dependent protein kinases [Dyadobacter soli]
MQQLIAHIVKNSSIKPEKLHSIGDFFEARRFKKKELLLQEGQRCHEKFFIVKGCVHLFYLRQNGVEQTIDFAMENWWASDFMAFQDGSIAKFSIRAIEATEVLAISASQQREMLAAMPELNEYFHLVFQRAYAAAQMRVRMTYELSKEDLYQDFSRKYPAFLQRVPQYLMASFLGFTPEYLSEIRKKFAS